MTAQLPRRFADVLLNAANVAGIHRLELDCLRVNSLVGIQFGDDRVAAS
jgi:hypothetical protein